MGRDPSRGGADLLLQNDIPAGSLHITNWMCILRELPCFKAFGRHISSNHSGYWPSLLVFPLRISKSNRDGLLRCTFVIIALSILWMAALFYLT